eukprot:2519279-Lingulodinium_polyedra.AAC.1
MPPPSSGSCPRGPTSAAASCRAGSSSLTVTAPARGPGCNKLGTGPSGCNCARLPPSVWATRWIHS